VCRQEFLFFFFPTKYSPLHRNGNHDGLVPVFDFSWRLVVFPYSARAPGTLFFFFSHSHLFAQLLFAFYFVPSPYTTPHFLQNNPLTILGNWNTYALNNPLGKNNFFPTTPTPKTSPQAPNKIFPKHFPHLAHRLYQSFSFCTFENLFSVFATKETQVPSTIDPSIISQYNTYLMPIEGKHPTVHTMTF